MDWKFNFYLNTGIIIFFAILFYITIIYPYKKKKKEHKNLIKNLKINDEILTKGGIIGKITNIKNKKYIILLINNKNKIIINKKYIINKIHKKVIKNLI